MKNLILFLLLAVTVNARWSAHYSRQIAANQDLDWWEHGTFYQIYPRSFKDSDGDGVGDLRGIIDNLDHLKDLGVTGFLLGPVFESPMVDGGYDITNFRQVDPLFGTNEDLAELFTKTKELDLKVLIDFVPNHTSDKHDWFALSAARIPGFENLYVWRDCVEEFDGSRRPPNNWIGVYHTRTWTLNVERDQCYLHHYTPEQPDLNFRDENVYNETLDIVRFWLEQGVDGFRIDAVRLYETENFPNEIVLNVTGDWLSRDNFLHDNTVNRPESFAFIREVRKIIDSFVENSNSGSSKILVTDTFDSVNTRTAQWYGEDEETPASNVPMNFALISKLNKDSNAFDFKNVFDDMFDAMPWWGEPNSVLGNHDNSRIDFRFGEGRHESLAILSLMMPGPNVIFYGEEIGMTDNRNISFEESDDPQLRLTNETVFMQFSRDPARTPFQWDDTAWAGFSNTTDRTWLPVHANYHAINLKAQKEADRSTFKMYQRLIELRKYNRVLQIGGYISTAVNETLFGYIRTLIGHNTIAVLVNLGGATTANLRDVLGDEYSSETRVRVLITTSTSTLQVGSTIGGNEYIELGPYDAVVLEVSSATKLVISMLLLLSSLIKLIA